MKRTEALVNHSFLFDVRHLEAGDIVLERGRDVGSSVVAAITRGHFSHALMWVGGGDFIEAMPAGVRTLQSVRVPIANQEYWALYRLRSGNLETALSAALHARRHCFKYYDLDGALRSAWLPKKRLDERAMFCSQLIAHAYHSVGVSLVPSKATSAITPNDLSRSNALKQVALPLVRTPKHFEEYFQIYGFDRSDLYEASPMAKERDISRALFALVEELVSSIEWAETSTPGNLAELLDRLSWLDPQHAQAIADRLLFGMKVRGYFTLITPAIEELIATRAIIGQVEQIPEWTTSKKRHEENAVACQKAFNRHPHELWLELRNMYHLNATGFSALIEIASGRA